MYQIVLDTNALVAAMRSKQGASYRLLSLLVNMHLETRILFSLYWLSSGFEADSG